MLDENSFAYSITLRDITYNKLNKMTSSSPSDKHPVAFLYFKTLAKTHKHLYSNFLIEVNYVLSLAK